MERLLVVKLEVNDCEAEISLNGVPLARANAARPRAIVPVHEFTVAGANVLQMVVWPHPVMPPGQASPAPLPLVASGHHWAHARILLPRMGSAIDEAPARTLSQVDWAPAAGTAYEAPCTLSQQVTLPVTFPRWRWLDAPPVDPSPALQAQAGGLLQSIAQDLAEGQTDRFIAAVRLRTEEIAVAYQRRPEDETDRLRGYLASLHAAGCLKWPPDLAQAVVLRPIAEGRLLECLDASGGPALRTEPNERGETWALPLRLAATAGRFHVLR
jgi:hypothetical protein